MQLLGVASMIVYCIYILCYYARISSPRKAPWYLYAVAVAINLLVAFITDRLDLHQWGPLLLMGSMMFSFNLLFHGSFLQVLYAGSIYMFSLYSSRGIIVSIYSMVWGVCVREILSQDGYYYTIYVLAVALSILLQMYIRKVAMPDAITKRLMNNRNLLSLMVVYLFTSMFFLVLVNEGRFFEIHYFWYAFLYLSTCIIGKLGLQLVINRTAKVVKLMEYEMHAHQLKEQLSRQLRHYQSYQRFTESYRAFRHDYKNMMTAMKTLLYNREYEQATQLFDEVHDIMQRDIQIHKVYSPNVLLDAILQDAANICEEKGIRFSAIAHLPEGKALTDVETVRVFANIMDNAIEACEKTPGSERFIEVISSTTQGWSAIEVSNSFNGELAWNNEELDTTKENKEFHGLGLRIVKETIESLGGLVLIEPDQEQKVFKIKLCIPKAQ